MTWLYTEACQQTNQLVAVEGGFILKYTCYLNLWYSATPLLRELHWLSSVHCVHSIFQAICIHLQSHAQRRASIFVWTRVHVSTDKNTALCEQ